MHNLNKTINKNVPRFIKRGCTEYGMVYPEYKEIDPTNKNLIDYEWFKFIHHKPAIHNLPRVKKINEYLFPNKTADAIYLGERRVSRVWHYYDKELNVRLS